MLDLDLAGAVLAATGPLPPMRAQAYEYVVGAGGLYKRSEDSRLEALVPVWLAPSPLPGAAVVTPYFRLRVPPVPAAHLWAVWESARRRLPDEVMYQIFWDPQARNSFGGWACYMPDQVGSPAALTFADTCEAVVDLHSHNVMSAFFSATDDEDEQGLRAYVVIGRLDTPRPQIAARVGVYGPTMRIPAGLVFDGLGPFVDSYERCRECGEAFDQACAGEDDLCSRCAGLPGGTDEAPDRA